MVSPRNRRCRNNNLATERKLITFKIKHMSKLIPQNGNVIIKPIEEQEQTIGNIVIPDMGKERPEIGEVIESSDTYNWHTGEFFKTKLTPGQKVLIPKMGSVKISVDGEDYFITKETEILAVYE